MIAWLIRQLASCLHNYKEQLRPQLRFVHSSTVNAVIESDAGRDVYRLRFHKEP